MRRVPALVVAAVLALAGCDALPALPGAASEQAIDTLAPPAGAQAARVVRVVDGDTLVLRGVGSGPLEHGRETRVRVLEVDTPEVDECYGAEATDFAERTLPEGSTVRVAADRDLLDRYGRTLLYVWAEDGTFYDEAVVRLGYGRAVLFEPNDRHIVRLRLAEAAARGDRAGLWGAC